MTIRSPNNSTLPICTWNTILKYNYYLILKFLCDLMFQKAHFQVRKFLKTFRKDINCGVQLGGSRKEIPLLTTLLSL